MNKKSKLNQSISQSVNQSISQSVNQSISQSVNQSISQSVSKVLSIVFTVMRQWIYGIRVTYLPGKPLLWKLPFLLIRKMNIEKGGDMYIHKILLPTYKRLRVNSLSPVLIGKLTSLFLASILFAGMAEAATLSGIVYLDADQDGTYDFGETLVQDATVNVYSSNGLACSGTTGPTSGWSCTTADAGPYRVEFVSYFSIWQSRGYFLPASMGGDLDSTVLFAPDGNSSGLDFALVDQGENIRIYYSYAQGTGFLNFPTASGSNLSTNYYPFSWLYGHSNLPYASGVLYTETEASATTGYFGGLAMQASEDKLYASAGLKLGELSQSGGNTAMLGAGGSGGIYVMDPTPSSLPSPPQLFLDVDDYFGNEVAGPDTCCDPGKRGLGDLEISKDEQTLYTINMATQELYEFPVAGGVAPAVGTANSYTIPKPASCPAADGLAASALATHPAGKVYIGAVCTAESTQDINNLRAYVLEFDPASGTFASSPVLDFSLDFPFTTSGGSYQNYIYWQATQTEFQPMVHDLAFDGQDLIIGFITRSSDEEIHEGHAITGGGLVRACWEGSAWALESGGVCGGVTGASGPYGPGGVAFYHLQNQEGGNTPGALAQVPGLSDLVASMADPVTLDYTFGLLHASNTSGLETASAEHPSASAYGKGNAMGDIEYLLLDPTLEIGNRVWNDADEDGIQDPSESVISGVVVGLYDAFGTLIDTVTTDASGNYVFSADSSKTDSAGKNYDVPMILGAQYTVAVLSSNFNTGEVLEGLSATLANAEGDTSNDEYQDVRDSDGQGVSVGTGTNSASTGATLVLGFTNNHGLDFGFRTAPACSISTPTISAQCNNNGTPTDPSDDTFTYTINATGTGTGSTYSISVDDTQANLDYGVDNTSPSSFNIAAGDLNLTLTDDTTASCTLNNVTVTAPATCSNPVGGSITIIKDATPDDPQDFAFTVSGSGVSNFSLDDDNDGTLSNSQSFTGLSDGSYSFSENAVANWTLTGITCSGASNSTITTNATGVDINLSGGENITCTFYNNNHTCPSGQILNQVVVAANEDETTYANNSDAVCLEVTGSPNVDLALTKTASATDAVSGDTVVYTITVTNNGPIDATGIEVMDQLPTGVTYASDTPSQGTYTLGTGIWAVGDLANGANATLAITVSVD
jgi:uncharacterized repeat protein (TIGR01451 family)